jgi:hypothetical protein
MTAGSGTTDPPIISNKDIQDDQDILILDFGFWILDSKLVGPADQNNRQMNPPPRAYSSLLAKSSSILNILNILVKKAVPHERRRQY